MKNHGTNRRTVIKRLGAGLVVGTIFSQSAAASATLAHELNTVRSATKKYRDVEKARSDGYDDHISVYVPGMGFHFEKEAFIASDENAPHDLKEPATLVYQTNGSYNPAPLTEHDPSHDDDLILGAAEFIHKGNAGADANYFDDENAKRNVKTSEADGWAVIPGPDPVHTGLHVWVHRGNPDGVFASFNPTVD